VRAFTFRTQRHLDCHGISLRSGLADRQRRRVQSRGPEARGECRHVGIPPAAHTYQSDLKTMRRLEEDEFFDLEDFSSRGGSPRQGAHLPALLQPRAAQHKEDQSLWQIIERLAHPNSVCFHQSCSTGVIPDSPDQRVKNNLAPFPRFIPSSAEAQRLQRRSFS